MLDIKFLKENKEKVVQNTINRNVKVDIDLILKIHFKVTEVKQTIEKLNQRKNQISKEISGNEDKNKYISEIRNIKISLPKLKEKQNYLEKQYKEEALKVPNMTSPDTPPGFTDKENISLRKKGIPTKFNFKAKNHLEICEKLDLLDFKAGAKVSGRKFYFLKNEAVLLEMALVKYATDIAIKHGFSLMTTPIMAKDEILSGAGFNPRGPENQIFSIEDSDMSLIGTSEITIGGYLSNTILNVDELPIKICGISDCFRKETGGYGQINKGLYRVPSFKKVELFQFVDPKNSEIVLEKILKIEEEIFQGLGLPYQVVAICAGDLGGPAYKKYDIEAWMPFINEKGDYGEVTSVSNCTDFQSRRWNIKFINTDGKKEYVHTLNGTAIATTRTMLAIIENFQQEDGSVKIPNVLHKYMNGIKQISKKK